MTCRKTFWKNTYVSMFLFEKHWENETNTKFEDIGNIIFSKFVFEPQDHRGLIVPQYYTCGIPSFLWTCKKCLETT